MGGARKRLTEKDLAELSVFQEKVLALVGGGSIRATADRLGVRYSTLQSWMYRGTKPALDQARLLIEASGLPFEYWADDSVSPLCSEREAVESPGEDGRSAFDRVVMSGGGMVYFGQVRSVTADEVVIAIPRVSSPLVLRRSDIVGLRFASDS